jgi:hypothetical protein
MRSRLVLMLLLTGVTAGGCESGKGTGALAGAGIGALIGAAAGDAEGALVGAAIGTGVGYIIGDQVDEKKAREMSAAGNTHGDVRPLGGTKWQLVNLTTSQKVAPYTAKMIEFRPDGHVITTTTLKNGTITVYDEVYRVVGDTLIVNKPGYLVNARYQMNGRELIISDPGFSAVLTRLSAS